MFHALHPNKEKQISYADYLQYALNHGHQRPNDATGARCTVCERRLKVKAGHKKDDGHFYHKDSQFCPTKDPASRPYIGLPPKKKDPHAVARNRDFAKNNLQNIWSRVKEIVPYIDLLEFVTILQEARKLNIYGYAGLQPEYLPYVYVTLINFLPSKSYKK